MPVKRKLLGLILIAVLLGGCAPVMGTFEIGIEDPGAGLQTEVAASATSPASPEPTTMAGMHTPQGSPAGTVSGKVCYPSEMIPAMTAFFQETASGEISEMDIEEDQAGFTIDLPPGKYIAFAYLKSGAELGGSYSEAVPCGLSADCTDHSPLAFEVRAGSTTGGVDLCDWYAPEAVPPNSHGARAELSGLVYVSPEGEYLAIEADGDAKKLFSGSGMIVPWVGPHGVYFLDNDLVAIDMFTGKQYNLTNTPEMIETSYQFEVGLPEQVLFTALPAGQEAGPGITGGLYLINIDGSGLRAIDAESNVAGAAASPSGQEIAYGAGETAYIYNQEGGGQVFDPREFGMDSPKGQFIASPSWSPLGDQLAWFMSGFFDGKETSGYGIFDLSAKTFRLAHPHSMPGMDGIPLAARWSPDGEWLAFESFDADPGRSGIWLVNSADAEQEIFMGAGSGNPVFGPWTAERKVLTYSRFDEAEGASRIWLYDLITNEHHLAPLPASSQVAKWW